MFKKGGKLFTVKNICQFRDGGTWEIKSNYPDLSFYIHKETNKLHHSYPPNETNIIKDHLLEYYILERLAKHIKNLRDNYKHTKKLIRKISKIYIK